MYRWLMVDEAFDVDIGVYEIYPKSRVFSYLVHSELEILPDDVVLVKFEPFYSRVLKLIRNGDVLIDVYS